MMNPGNMRVKVVVDAENMQAQSRVEARLAELIGFDTRNPGGNEQALADRLARELSSLGADGVEVFGTGAHFSTFARFGTHAPKLVLNAHIDTVLPNSGYSADPLRAIRREGRLHGLGSADTKGAIAAILEALAARKDQGSVPHGLAVLFSGDEELGGTCIRQFLSSDRVRGIERAVVCEPTGCRVGVRHRGLYAARIRARSAGGHSSLADTIPNPLAALARAGVALDDLGAHSRDLGPATMRGLCMNVAALDGGMAFNIIPAEATLTFSMRPAPGVDLAAIVEKARTVVQTASAPLVTEWEAFGFNPPFETQSPADFVAWMGDIARNPVDLPFGTEAGQFVDKGIDAVVFGPGRVEQAHKADEYVDLDELDAAVRVFMQVIP
jgi:acetylornithine deacetylase